MQPDPFFYTIEFPGGFHIPEKCIFMLLDTIKAKLLILCFRFDIHHLEFQASGWYVFRVKAFSIYAIAETVTMGFTLSFRSGCTRCRVRSVMLVVQPAVDLKLIIFEGGAFA